MVRIIFIITLLSSIVFSEEPKKESVQSGIKKKIENINWEKAQQLEELEKLEASRWDIRQKNQNKIDDIQNKIRKAENKYSRLVNSLGQKQEELIRVSNESRAEELLSEESKSRGEKFILQISQTVEKELEHISSDIPVGITQRLSSLNQLSGELNKIEAVNVSSSISQFFDLKNKRLELTKSQKIKIVDPGNNKQGLPAYQLRLGTIFAAEKQKDNDNIHLLLRTGRVKGKVFVWRSELSQENKNELSLAIQNGITAKQDVLLTMDVLQNKSWGTGYTQTQELSFGEKMFQLVEDGGLVMYPLMLAAFLGLLLSLERFIFFLRKSAGTRSFAKKVKPQVDGSAWEEALKICKNSSTSLSRVIEGILKNASLSRDAAEKGGKEALLKEFPALEKRMVFLAAIGGAAPLMGLLGTVSGMISLFQVITDVGTNDPRILAGGISEALVTTQTGLMIAIPILLVHGYLTDRIERIQNEITAKSFEVLNKIWPNGNTN